jgi:hypothetical protein
MSSSTHIPWTAGDDPPFTLEARMADLEKADGTFMHSFNKLTVRIQELEASVVRLQQAQDRVSSWIDRAQSWIDWLENVYIWFRSMPRN